MNNKQRPYVVALLVCESVLQEVNLSLTAVRIIDRITVGFNAPPGTPIPTTPPPMTLNFTVLAVLRGGPARGKREFLLKIVSPTGDSVIDAVPFSAIFENETTGANFLLRVGLQTNATGVYWVELYVNGDREPLARTPVQVVYNPNPTPR